jgi:inhibitor of KinA sporulation pathway (predicted exonuclease)
MSIRLRTDHICVMDLEATCWCDKQPPGSPAGPNEIIEIGAVMVAMNGLKVEGEFNAFVKPVQNPTLSDFCKELTHITQEDVDRAGGFVAVHEKLVTWLGVCGVGSILLASQGLYDYRQLLKDCTYHGVPFPFRGDHMNLKELVAFKMGWKKRGCGQKKALDRMGIPIEGAPHRAINDAKMATKMLQRVCYLGEEGEWYRPTAADVMRGKQPA